MNHTLNEKRERHEGADTEESHMRTRGRRQSKAASETPDCRRRDPQLQPPWLRKTLLLLQPPAWGTWLGQAELRLSLAAPETAGSLRKRPVSSPAAEHRADEKRGSEWKPQKLRAWLLASNSDKAAWSHYPSTEYNYKPGQNNLKLFESTGKWSKTSWNYLFWKKNKPASGKLAAFCLRVPNSLHKVWGRVTVDKAQGWGSGQKVRGKLTGRQPHGEWTPKPVSKTCSSSWSKTPGGPEKKAAGNCKIENRFQLLFMQGI